MSREGFRVWVRSNPLPEALKERIRAFDGVPM